MKRPAQDAKNPQDETFQNRLLFWLAAALAPESAPWYVGYTPSLFRYAELTDSSAESAPVPAEEPAQSEAPLEAQRRAA